MNYIDNKNLSQANEEAICILDLLWVLHRLLMLLEQWVDGTKKKVVNSDFFLSRGNNFQNFQLAIMQN